MWYDPKARTLSSSDFKDRRLNVLVDLSFLSQCERPWTHLFIVEGEVGEQIYQQFRKVNLEKYGQDRIRKLVVRPQRVPGGIVMHQPSEVPQIEPTEMHHYTQSCVFDRLLVFGSEAKSLLTLACLLLDLSSLAENHPSRDETPQIHLVAAPGSSLGEAGMQTEVFSLAELESKARSFLAAIGDFQPARSAKYRDTATQNDTESTSSIGVKSHPGPFDLRVITESCKGQTAIIVPESQYGNLRRVLSGMDQASISIFRIPDSLMDNNET